MPDSKEGGEEVKSDNFALEVFEESADGHLPSRTSLGEATKALAMHNFLFMPLGREATENKEPHSIRR